MALNTNEPALMTFSFSDLDGNRYEISKPGDITKEDMRNFSTFATIITNARQEDVIVNEAYRVAEEGDEDDED